ncbi:PorT family protein [Parabacteroides sp. 52]|uniref:type IX secretion/gliding motility protein PorT/SprT n=1 Tax=unclassified Parabacteroides TaxID=2649774 RepID=UPI0013D72D97|nr:MULTISPECIES: porin family protein [unclassified Parabacteroides]NDV55034.1 PorT family protein [Parabacteroides sp. 52]
MAQVERVKNQPYADMKLYHLGFHVGIHSQDLLLTQNGVMNNGEIWFAEIPSYSPGFSVGVIGDMYLNPYFNLRVSPSLHFGDKKFIFREQNSEVEYRTNVRSTYVTLPVDIKYSAFRLNNYRPYLIGGIYGALDIGRKKGHPLLMKGIDYGLEFGIGCDIYLPFFKFCPELKFCFGLADVLEKNRTDLTDKELIKYTDALSKATSRMVILTFNFE